MVRGKQAMLGLRLAGFWLVGGAGLLGEPRPGMMGGRNCSRLAKTYLEKASAQAPGQPATLYHLAWCEAKLGDSAAARAALQKALDSKTKFMERDAAQKLLDSIPAGGK
jgi:hypothetical protein